MMLGLDDAHPNWARQRRSRQEYFVITAYSIIHMKKASIHK